VSCRWPSVSYSPLPMVVYTVTFTPSSGSGLSTADHCRSRLYRSNISLREMSLLVGRCLPRRQRVRRKLQPPLSKGQPSHATLTQSSRECRSQDQRKHIRDRVSPLGPAPGTQSSHRSHRPSTVPTDLADPAPRSPLRRTRPSGHQTIEATAHLEDDPATPKPRLSDRTTESSTKPSTSAVIFDPGVLPASSCVNGSQESPFSVTHTMSTTQLFEFTPRVASAAPAA